MYVLGGSTAADLYLDQEEAWVHLVQEGLNRRPGQPRTWVGNLARPSLASLHHLIHLERLLPELPRADLLVALVGVNDLQLALKSSYLDAGDARDAPRVGVRPPAADGRGRGRPGDGARGAPRLADLAADASRVRSDADRGRLRAAPAVPADGAGREPGRRAARSRAGARTSTAGISWRSPPRARSYGAPMLLLTQPTLWAAEMGPAERARLLAGGLGPIKTWCAHQRYYSPRALAEGMRAFNDVLRGVCRQPDVPCRDLAAARARPGRVLLRRHASVGSGRRASWPSW